MCFLSPPPPAPPPTPTPTSHNSACVPPRRMHVTLEDMAADEELMSLLQDLLLLGDRAKPSDLPALNLEEEL